MKKIKLFKISDIFNILEKRNFKFSQNLKLKSIILQVLFFNSLVLIGLSASSNTNATKNIKLNSENLPPNLYIIQSNSDKRISLFEKWYIAFRNIKMFSNKYRFIDLLNLNNNSPQYGSCMVIKEFDNYNIGDVISNNTYLKDINSNLDCEGSEEIFGLNDERYESMFHLLQFGSHISNLEKLTLKGTEEENYFDNYNVAKITNPILYHTTLKYATIQFNKYYAALGTNTTLNESEFERILKLDVFNSNQKVSFYNQFLNFVQKNYYKKEIHPKDSQKKQESVDFKNFISGLGFYLEDPLLQTNFLNFIKIFMKKKSKKENLNKNLAESIQPKIKLASPVDQKNNNECNDAQYLTHELDLKAKSNIKENDDIYQAKDVVLSLNHNNCASELITSNKNNNNQTETSSNIEQADTEQLSYIFKEPVITNFDYSDELMKSCSVKTIKEFLDQIRDKGVEVNKYYEENKMKTKLTYLKNEAQLVKNSLFNLNKLPFFKDFLNYIKYKENRSKLNMPICVSNLLYGLSYSEDEKLFENQFLKNKLTEKNPYFFKYPSDNELNDKKLTCDIYGNVVFIDPRNSINHTFGGRITKNNSQSYNIEKTYNTPMEFYNDVVSYFYKFSQNYQPSFLDSKISLSDYWGQWIINKTYSEKIVSNFLQVSNEYQSENFILFIDPDKINLTKYILENFKNRKQTFTCDISSIDSELTSMAVETEIKKVEILASSASYDELNQNAKTQNGLQKLYEESTGKIINILKNKCSQKINFSGEKNEKTK